MGSWPIIRLILYAKHCYLIDNTMHTYKTAHSASFQPLNPELLKIQALGLGHVLE